MKACPAIALALIGWYLMLLPTSPDADLSDPTPWSAVQLSFDTAKECEAALAKATLPRGKAKGAEPKAFFCIASDDPRLPGK
jgi:hypothetical protein